jgi:hypothetical protein
VAYKEIFTNYLKYWGSIVGDSVEFFCLWSSTVYGRHNGGLSPHPLGDASVFVRKK